MYYENREMDMKLSEHNYELTREISYTDEALVTECVLMSAQINDWY